MTEKMADMIIDIPDNEDEDFDPDFDMRWDDDNYMAQYGGDY